MTIRQWRVGTLSMGVTLILLGTVLFLTQWNHREAFLVLIDWWPIVFILLGLELLAYLAVARKENPVVKYDVYSVFFVGFLIFVSIVFTLLASTGLMYEARRVLGAVERTVELPAIEQTIDGGVRKVVVINDALSSVAIDTAGVSSINVFGSVRSEMAADGGEAAEDIVTLQRVGDTIYIRVNEPPHRRGLFSNYPRLNVTIVVPEGVKTEAYGRHEFI